MKKISIVIILLIVIAYQNGQSQGCPEFCEYNHMYVKEDFSLCSRNDLSKDDVFSLHSSLTFHFPVYTQIQNGSNWHIEVILDDGQGRLDIGPDQMISTTYATTGEKRVEIYWVKTPIWGQNEPEEYYLRGAFRFTINDTPQSYVSPDHILNITTNTTWAPPSSGAYPAGSPYLSNSAGIAKAYIKYAPGHSSLVKPVIFVDGLDLNNQKFTDPNFGNEVIRYGNQGWDVISTGARESRVFVADGDYNEFQYYPTAFSDLQNLGYDIVFLDFERGSDYIQKNGRLLIECLNQVNSLKQPDPQTGILHGNVVIGASMGGQIARWALATMEKEGAPHCTSTYISFDSPHKGANISMGLQAAAWFFNKTGQSPDLWEFLNSPAPRQLLVDNFGDAYNDGRLESINWAYESDSFPPDYSIDFSGLREAYVTEMEDLGYPKNLRNIAISCGSQIGNDLGYNSDDELLIAQLYITSGLNAAWGNVFQLGLSSASGSTSDMNISHATPSCGKHVDQNISYNTIFGAAFPRTTLSCYDIGWFNDPSDVPYEYYSVKVTTGPTAVFPNYDSAPGCFRPDLLGFRETLRKLLTFQGQGQGIVTSEIVGGRDKVCFMPTMSALDIDWEMNNVNMWKDISNENILANNLTPFDAYYAPDNNLKHVELTKEMADWVIAQLEDHAPDLQGSLPTSNGLSTYNFGNDTPKEIPGVTVQNGGYLRVNNQGPTRYGNGSSTQDELFEARTANCEGSILIEQGGYFILGNDAPNGSSRKANVQVTSGTNVHIKNGGTLRLARGSHLIIESGATLEIDANANIDLWWGESTIHIKDGGELRINGDFNFDGSGYFQFSKGNILSFGSNASGFNLTGQGASTRFIKINAEAVLELTNKDLNLSSGLVESLGTIRINSGAARANIVKFYGGLNSGVTNVALVLNKPTLIDINLCRFYDTSDAISISESDILNSNNVRILSTNFHNCTNSVNVSDSELLRLISCNFYPNPQNINSYGGTAIIANNVSEIDLVGSVIQDYSVPDGYAAVELHDVDLFKMQSSTIDNSSIGIWAPCPGSGDNTTNVTMESGSIISNCDKGIFIERGGVMDGSNPPINFGAVTMRCSKLINNTTGIKGTDVRLNIDGCNGLNPCMPNHFQKPTPTSTSKYFDIVYLPNSITTPILATNNYWNWNPSNSIHYRLRIGNSFSGCEGVSSNISVPANFSNALASPPINCTNTPHDPNPNPDDKDKFTSDGNNNNVNEADGRNKTTLLKDSALQVWPNPASESIQVSFGETTFEVEVYNVLGKLQFANSMNSGETISLANWTSGLYWLTATNPVDGKRKTIKIVVE